MVDTFTILNLAHNNFFTLVDSENDLAAWRGDHVGIIFQFFQMLPSLSLLQNVILPMDFCGLYHRTKSIERANGWDLVVEDMHQLTGIIKRPILKPK